MEWLPVDVTTEIALRCELPVHAAQMTAAGIPLHTAAFGDRVARASKGRAMAHHLHAIQGTFPWHVLWFCLCRCPPRDGEFTGFVFMPISTVIQCAQRDPTTVPVVHALSGRVLVGVKALMDAARMRRAEDYMRHVVCAAPGVQRPYWWDAIRRFAHNDISPRPFVWRALRALALHCSNGPDEAATLAWESWDRSMGTLVRAAHAPVDTVEVIDGVSAREAWRAFRDERPETCEDFDLMLRRLSVEKRIADAEMTTPDHKLRGGGNVPLLLFPDKQHVVEGAVTEHVEFNDVVMELSVPAPRKGHSSLWVVGHDGKAAKLFTGDPDYALDMFRGLTEHDYEAQNFVVLSDDHHEDMALILLHSRGLDSFRFYPACEQSPVPLPD